MKNLLSWDMAEQDGHEVVAIIRAAHSISIGPRRVVANAHIYPSGGLLLEVTTRFKHTIIKVTNETPLNVARRLIAADERAVAFDFASATDLPYQMFCDCFDHGLLA